MENHVNNRNQEGRKLSTSGKVRCKFELFVRLYDHVPSKFKGGDRVWTYRGDKFQIDDLNKMLINLVRLLSNNYRQFLVVQLIDTDYDKDDYEYLLFHMVDKSIKWNILFEKYDYVFEKIMLPGWIKTIKKPDDNAQDIPR